MNRSRFIDLHLLHFVPAACLNRDQDGEPKTLELGGSTRAMVSSQAWKRPVRLGFEAALDEYAARTRRVPPVVTERLLALGWPGDLALFAAEQIALSAKTGGLKTNPAEGHRTQAMVFLPTDVPDELAALCVEYRPVLEKAMADLVEARKDKPKAKTTPVLPAKPIAAQLTRRTVSIDFLGRMFAELAEVGHVEAAVQMAPAFTVNRADPQPDFFTGVESWPLPGDAGSAHLDAAYLTSGVFYRYTTINVTDLIGKLGDRGDLRDLIEVFLTVAIRALPQGKKTSTAPHTLPDLVHYAVRDSSPVSYAPAFEEPVRPGSRGGHLAPARAALAAYAAKADRLIGTRDRIAHGHTGAFDTPITQLGAFHASFTDLAAACATAALTPAGFTIPAQTATALDQGQPA